VSVLWNVETEVRSEELSQVGGGCDSEAGCARTTTKSAENPTRVAVDPAKVGRCSTVENVRVTWCSHRTVPLGTALAVSHKNSVFSFTQREFEADLHVGGSILKPGPFEGGGVV
jgi:hypothetical protein